MTEEDHNAAKLSALNALSAATREITCAESKVSKISGSLNSIVNQPGHMNNWKFEDDDKVLIPDGSQAITSTHQVVTYPSYQEIRRVVLSRREAITTKK